MLGGRFSFEVHLARLLDQLNHGRQVEEIADLVLVPVRKIFSSPLYFFISWLGHQFLRNHTSVVAIFPANLLLGLRLSVVRSVMSSHIFVDLLCYLVVKGLDFGIESSFLLAVKLFVGSRAIPE